PGIESRPKRLLSGVVGLALFDERLDGLAHVGGPQADGLGLGFDDEPESDRDTTGRLHRALRALHRERWLRGDRRRERTGIGFQRVVVDEPLTQSDAIRLVGVDAGCGPDELLGLARADDARQSLGSAQVGQDPVLVLEQTY